MAVEATHLRIVEQLVPTTFQDPDSAYLLATAVTTRHGRGDLCATHAESADANEYSARECDQRPEWVTGQLIVRAIVYPWESFAMRVRSDRVRSMARKLVWIESQDFEGFGCSQCQWVFNPAGPLVDRALDKMKEAYEVERDKAFASHVCANFSRKIVPKK